MEDLHICMCMYVRVRCAVSLLLAANQVTACFLFVATFTVPMVNYPMRISLHYMVFGETKASELQHLVETVVPVGASLIISIFVDNVGLVFSFIGAVTACAISFIIPGILFLRSQRLKDRTAGDVAVAWGVFALGITVACVGFGCAVAGAVKA